MANFRIQMLEALRGTRALHFLEEFQQSQWWPRERLWEDQDAKLRDLIRHTSVRVPFYREYFAAHKLRPSDIRSRKDLEKLPIIDKKIISARPDAFVADNRKAYRPRINKTSGTTGTPFAYLLARDAWSAGIAATWRGWEWGGYQLGDRMALLAGTALIRDPLGAKGVRNWFYYNVFQNILTLDGFRLDDDKLSRHVDLLRKRKPLFLRGYPGAVHDLADYCRRTGRDDIAFQAVYCTAEQLLLPQRELIEKQFRCALFDDYGCYDGSLKAMECERHRGYHLAMETAIVEFVRDGVSVRPGERGEVVVTGLNNYAQPFIRYRVGDVGVPSGETCPCGRGLARIERIEGRSNDVVLTRDGRTIHGLYFSLFFWETSWVAQFQVRQEDLDGIKITLVVKRPPTREESESLKRLLAEKMRPLTVEIVMAKRIEESASGKARFIVSTLTHPPPTQD
jgi:phenylacetate-CoA ligase